jgi:2-octaprenylphenol hydroxylase
MITQVAIVGGGISGLTAALDLARRGLRVTVLDRRPIKDPNPLDTYLDSRIYTIRPGLIRYLSSLGVWQRVDASRLQPVLGMRVKGSEKKSLLDFDSLKCGLESLATTVEEGCLKEALIRACGVNGNIDYRSDCAFENLEYQTDVILVKTSRGDILSKLLIAADGLRSNVRSALKIDFVVKDYQSFGIVANFEIKRPHGGYAHQIFSDEGILALLPLPGNRVSMVWSLPETLAKTVLSAGEEALSDLVFRRFDILGSLRCITPPRSFPLRKGVARRYTADRLALVGDALRHIHPLAGQGLNLGIADARVLGELIGASRTDDPGSQQILRRYARARREETIVFAEFTDLLSGLFSRNKLWSNIGNTGFRLVNQCRPLKRYFVNRAAE